MEQAFCAESSRQSEIDPIGSAGEHSLYFAIECPPPWKPRELESESVPDNLRKLAKQACADYDRYQARFLLIYNEDLKQETYTRLLIFRKPPGLIQGYQQQEFHLASIAEVAPLIEQYLMGTPVDIKAVEPLARDILVCTHGSRDRCCARFGNGLYRQACQMVRDRGLNQVRIWEASHIGGHRFAPTAIDFPEGRYYGYLDTQSLETILTKTGDITSLNQVYRGWGILPWAAQVVEKKLLLKFGWDWFKYSISAKIIDCNQDETVNQVELTYESGDDQFTYRAQVVAEQTKAIFLKGSCYDEEATEVVPYAVKNLVQI